MALKFRFLHIYTILVLGLSTSTLTQANNKPESKCPAFFDLSKDVDTLEKIRASDPKQKQQLKTDYSFPKSPATWEKATVVANWIMSGIVFSQVATNLYENPQSTWLAAGLLIPAYYSADLLFQVMHKYLDSYASEDHWFWKETVRDFRIHHEFPDNLATRDYLSNVASFAKIFAPFFLWSTFTDLPPEIEAPLLLFLVASANTTEFHKQAHLKKPNFFFGMLQKFKLALSHKAHLEHHKPPFEGEYSVLNGWSQGLATKLNFWTHLDKLFWKFYKKMPHNWVQDPRSIPPQVMEDLKKDLSLIPPQLWIYNRAYPARMSTELKDLVEKAQHVWKKKFLDDRKKFYEKLTETNPERASELMEKEKASYPWIFEGEDSTY